MVVAETLLATCSMRERREQCKVLDIELTCNVFLLSKCKTSLRRRGDASVLTWAIFVQSHPFDSFSFVRSNLASLEQRHVTDDVASKLLPFISTAIDGFDDYVDEKRTKRFKLATCLYKMFRGKRSAVEKRRENNHSLHCCLSRVFVH